METQPSPPAPRFRRVPRAASIVLLYHLYPLPHPASLSARLIANYYCP